MLLTFADEVSITETQEHEAAPRVAIQAPIETLAHLPLLKYAVQAPPRTNVRWPVPMRRVPVRGEALEHEGAGSIFIVQTSRKRATRCSQRPHMVHGAQRQEDDDRGERRARQRQEEGTRIAFELGHFFVFKIQT